MTKNNIDTDFIACIIRPLRAKRRASDISQEEMARIIGVTRQTIVYFETCKRVSFSVFIGYCRYFDCFYEVAVAADNYRGGFYD